MSKADFLELAWNDHRSALIALFDELTAVKAELLAAEQTIVELSAAVHATA